MLLSCEHVSLDFGDRPLLDDISFYLNAGEKFGVIGVNGKGKSTFLRVLSGSLLPDRGKIARDPNVQLVMLEQNPQMDDNNTLMEQMFCQLPPNFREWKEYEAKTMLTRLGLPDPSRKVGTLSGGQKKRLALASVLIHPADVLILDEPTNHLDARMTEWLEDWLRKFSGGLVMVTHDRYFLERVTNHLLELSHGILSSYVGNYSRYLQLKAEQNEMALASERKRQSILRKEREWIERGCKARSTKSRERIERYEDLLNRSAPEEDSTIRISASSSRLGKKLIELRHVSKKYADFPVIRDFSFHLLRTDRIGIIGENGAGKTTLLNLMSGLTSPDAGEVEIGSTVKLGYFTQEAKEMEPHMRVYDYIHEIAEEVPTEDGVLTAKAMMERFLFDTNLQRQPIGKLSGGEKRRLYLLSVLMRAPNVLFLDEPTNDLDIMTLSILEDYLESFPGPILMVSHDRFMLDRMAETILEVKDGLVTAFTGNWSDWMNKRAAQNEPEPPHRNRKKQEPNAGLPDAGRPGTQAETKKPLRFTFKEQREFDTIDADIAALEEQLRQCEQKQQEFCSDYVKLREWMDRQRQLQAELEEKEERWLYLHDLNDRIIAGKA